jgi:hypothetical protein
MDTADGRAYDGLYTPLSVHTILLLLLSSSLLFLPSSCNTKQRHMATMLPMDSFLLSMDGRDGCGNACAGAHLDTLPVDWCAMNNDQMYVVMGNEKPILLYHVPPFSLSTGDVVLLERSPRLGPDRLSHWRKGN